jgi:hypothetical protein
MHKPLRALDRAKTHNKYKNKHKNVHKLSLSHTHIDRQTYTYIHTHTHTCGREKIDALIVGAQDVRTLTIKNSPKP